MDIEKAIEFQKNCGKIYCADPKEVASIFNCTIQALEEYEQYLQIGTVDECRSAMEKQTPKEPIMKPYDDLEDEYLCCPTCGEVLTDRIPFEPKTFYFHCLNCGQKFKWGD